MLLKSIHQTCASVSRVTGFTDWGVQTDKVCEVSWSDMHQALLDCPFVSSPAFASYSGVFRYLRCSLPLDNGSFSLCMSLGSNPLFMSYYAMQRVPCPCSSSRFVDLRRVCWRMSTAIGAARGLRKNFVTTCGVAGNGLMMFYV